MFLVLHRIDTEHGVMGAEPKYIEYNLPIDLLGPFEVHPQGTMVYLRNNMGYVIIKETTEEIRGAVGNMLNAVARQNNG